MPKRTSGEVNLMVIASGNGTGMFSIMKTHHAGQIPEVGQIVLVSTKPGAGCIEKANDLDYPSVVIEVGSTPFQYTYEKREFLNELSRVAQARQCRLVFLVGCNVIVPFDSSIAYPICGLPMYNIHPADIDAHGGQGMHGLRVHEHVLEAELDHIRRGKKSLGCDRFFTYPTVHEVTERPDDGPPLLMGAVEIPSTLLQGVLDGTYDIRAAALKLREIVLPYEWLMLPAAVRLAAQRMLNAST
ncbi:MAG: formyltransferase family protein [Candidatus Moraniibacteriota bacterium]